MTKEPTSSGHIASESRGTHEDRPEPCGFRTVREHIRVPELPSVKETRGGVSTEMALCGLAPIRPQIDLLEPGWVMSIVL